MARTTFERLRATDQTPEQFERNDIRMERTEDTASPRPPQIGDPSPPDGVHLTDDACRLSAETAIAARKETI